MSLKNYVRVGMVGGVLVLVGCGDNHAAHDSGIEPPDIDAPKPDARPADAAPDTPPDAFVIPVINQNSGFESGTMTGWICNGNATCTVGTTDAHTGTYSASAVNLPNDYSGFRINVLPLVCPTDATCATGATLLGRTLRFDAFMKNVGAATAVRLVLRWACSDGTNGYTWLKNVDNPTPDTWNEYDAMFVIPNCDYLATDGNLYLYTGTAGATELRIDDLQITDVTPP